MLGSPTNASLFCATRLLIGGFLLGIKRQRSTERGRISFITNQKEAMQLTLKRAGLPGRREFIGFDGGAAALPRMAQRPGKIPVVSCLRPGGCIRRPKRFAHANFHKGITRRSIQISWPLSIVTFASAELGPCFRGWWPR